MNEPKTRQIYLPSERTSFFSQTCDANNNLLWIVKVWQKKKRGERNDETGARIKVSELHKIMA
jgi:hypothetical protein